MTKPLPVDLMRAPWWLPGGNAQTIWSACCARTQDGRRVQFQRQRWDAPDGDFIDVDSVPLDASDARPVLVLFHGLEGSSHSHYAQAWAQEAKRRGWHFMLPHFRGCSGELNWAPRAYHSGDHVEIDWILRRIRIENKGAPIYAVGVSLGGNALMRWAVEQGREASRVVSAVAAISAPLDLAAAGRSIDQGFNRLVYARMFLRTMVRKAEAKWRQFPGLFDVERARSAKTLYEFDNAFTAPIHGFASTDDYWRQASAKPGLCSVEVPALLLNACNDPFVPADSLPKPSEVARSVVLWQPPVGGHVGFVSANGMGFPGHLGAMPKSVADWLIHHAGA